jgi:hypothetical protein
MSLSPVSQNKKMLPPHSQPQSVSSQSKENWAIVAKCTAAVGGAVVATYSLFKGRSSSGSGTQSSGSGTQQSTGSGGTGTTGGSGPTGTTGGSGATGTTGTPSATGTTGGSGGTGATGSSSAAGSSGVTGTTGASGPTGVTGSSSSSSSSSATGDSDATGSSGGTGTTGASGPTGATGSSSSSSSSSAAGSSGVIGPTGGSDGTGLIFFACLAARKNAIDFVNGKICCQGDSNCKDSGTGIITEPNGNVYDGGIERGVPHGKGTMHTAQGFYEVEFFEGALVNNEITIVTLGQVYWILGLPILGGFAAAALACKLIKRM